MTPRRVVICGAAGRDFHNFNVVYRDDPGSVVVAFTATQIPGIADRRYPAALAGPRYPEGIPIEDEVWLEDICRRERADEVVFAYSDVTDRHVMALASRALAAGADFRLLGPRHTMLTAGVPVVAVSAVRTGCGKSPIARWLASLLREKGHRVAVIRHPMPYSDLTAQRMQRFTSAGGPGRRRLHHRGNARNTSRTWPSARSSTRAWITPRSSRRLPARPTSSCGTAATMTSRSCAPTSTIVVADALRPDDARGYYPGEAVLRTADVVVVNKANAARSEDVERAVRSVNACAPVVCGAMPTRIEPAIPLRGRRVLVVEDGPTITHGSLPHGAGFVAATAAGAIVVDPRPALTAPMRAVFATDPHIGPVLPAVGYSPAQRQALRDTIERSDAEIVLAATPIDLRHVVAVSKPILRVRYEFAEAGTLTDIVDDWLTRCRRRTQETAR
jgi:predicted GTPase